MSELEFTPRPRLSGPELDRALDTVIRAWGVQEGILPSVGQSIPDSVIGTKKSISSHIQQYAERRYVDVKCWRPLGWNLPGNGMSYDLCGHIHLNEGKGCLNVAGHTGPMAGLIKVRKISATCWRAECPVCYQKWAARSAGRIEDKFKRLTRNNAEAAVPNSDLGRCLHVVVSVPEKHAHLMKDDYPKLRRMVYKAAKRAGVVGGCAIVHPYANKNLNEENLEKVVIDELTGKFNLISLQAYFKKMGKSINFWFERPHFHLLCYAPRDWDNNHENDPFTKEKVAKIEAETGFVVKNLGVRDSVRQTAFYQLSHAGIKSGVQTISWFGRLSNRMYKNENPRAKIDPVPEKCDECGNELKPVRYDPVDPEYRLLLSCVLYGDDLDRVLEAESRSPLEGRGEGAFWTPPYGWRYLRNGEKNHSCLIKKSAMDDL